MTIDEAISHALEVAEQNETQADKIGRQLVGSAIDKYATGCRECAADHRQLAEWLTDYKELREENKVLTSECDRLIKEKGELLSKVSGGDVLKICQLEEQLEKAKRLLKAAVEDINWINEHTQDEDGSCIMRINSGCSGCPLDINSDLFCKWKHNDEALKLIGEDEDENS